MMRVAIISDLVRPNGAGVMALLAAEVLTAAGHETIVIGGAMNADLQSSLAQDHYAAEAFTHDERALDGSVTATDHQSFTRSFRRWLDSLLVEHRPDVLYVHNCGRVLSQLDLADLSQRVPVAHTMHDEWFFTDSHYTFRSPRSGQTVRTFEPGRSDSVIEHRFDHLFDLPTRVGAFAAIGPSRWITDRARRMFPTLRIEHIANAVDTSLFDLQDKAGARRALGLPLETPIVLFVGSTTQERKGFGDFVDAMHALQSTTDRMPLALVVGGTASVATGDARTLVDAGPIADLLDSPALNPLGSVGTYRQTVVVSGLDRDLMPAIYGAADVLVHPSIIDNLPTVPIEAGLCGTRCLASDVGGTAETIADVTDLFHSATSAQALGGLILRAIEDVAEETVDHRRTRRAAQLDRFGLGPHSDAVIALLEELGATGSDR